MKLEETSIPGCYIIHPFKQTDHRGDFVKIYNSNHFNLKNLDFKINEVYYSKSNKNVFRGFHFQVPPHDHAKIVFCSQGNVIDFVIDLRQRSATYKRVASFELNEFKGLGVLIPKGCAHGFYANENDSKLVYLLQTVYNQASDCGILWSSLRHDFKFQKPIISERDLGFISIDDFKSPFV